MIPDTQNKELIVRKRMSAFIEKVLRFRGYDFRHDDYKQIIYAEEGCKTPLEDMIKSTYDAYSFLLSNAKSPLSRDILKKFFYILTGKEASESLIIRMVSKFFHMTDMPGLERAIEYHFYVSSEIASFNDDQRFIIPLMFFNYGLVKTGIPTLRFVYSSLEKYVECKKEYLEGNSTPIYALFLNLIQEAKFQDKSFYKNLRPIMSKTICNRFLKDKEMLQTSYGIKSIALFGSFAKGLQRIDSDVDLLVTFSDDIPYETKVEKKEKFIDYYFNIFNRYIDVLELSEYVSDWIIKEVINYKKIF